MLQLNLKSTNIRSMYLADLLSTANYKQASVFMSSAKTSISICRPVRELLDNSVVLSKTVRQAKRKYDSNNL